MHDGSRVPARALVVAVGLGTLPVLTLWFGPNSTELPQLELWQPFDLPIAAAALLLWLLLATVVRAPRIPSGWIRPLAVALAVVPTVWAAAVLPDTVSNDERAYLLHAEMFASGHLTQPLVEPREALRRRQVYEDEARGVVYPKYSPGTGAALAPGVWVGAPAIGVLVAGLLDLWLLAAVARRLGVREAWVAALLFASCPLFLLLQTSFQSELFTLPAALAGYLALLRVRAGAGSNVAWGAVLGACAGWILLTRPLSGAVFAAATALGLLVPAAGRSGPNARALFAAALGGLPFAAALLLYDRALTGDAFLTPYAAYAARFSPWDVYPVFFAETVHAPGRAFAASLATQVARWLPAVGGVLGAAGVGVFGLWRLRRLDGGAGLALLVLSIAAYGMHWYPGHWAYLGPIYAVEALALAVVAAVVVLEDSPPGWLRGLSLAALVAGPVLFACRAPLIVEQARMRAAPQAVAAARALPADSVVLLPPAVGLAKPDGVESRYTPSRFPFPPGIVYVRKLDRREPTRAALAALGLEGRPVFRFVPDADGGGDVVAFE